MERARLTELLRDPAGTDRSDMEALRSMADRFPWFGGARLLLAVGGHNSNDLLANDARGVPAAVLPSRSVLFDLVNKREEAQPTAVVAAALPPEAPQAPPAAPEPVEAVSPAPQPADGPLDSAAETAIAAMETEVQPALGAPAMPSPGEATPEQAVPVAAEEAPEPGPSEAAEPTTPAVQPVPEADDELGRMYAEALHASAYDLSDWATPPPAPPPAPTAMEEAHPEQPRPAPKKPAPASGTRRSFTDWLDATADAGAALEFPAPKRDRAAKPGMDVLSQQQLMDRFIQLDTPPPPKQRAEFFKPQQTAKRSLQDDGLVSETLARIHEKQGNFAKAIEVYDRLAAKHPEKSVYFAALSKALQARSNK